MHYFLSILLSVFTVVIDAGHGGNDPGAVGRKVKEKDLNLSVALKLGKLIEEQYSKEDVRVVYTRKDDRFLPLQERADIVNKAGADLFICIHTNAAENRNVRGAETFVLGTEKMDKNLDVAMRENAVIKLEENYETTYQGFDPNSIDSYIMFELMQNGYMDQSLRYAMGLQRHFSDTLRRADRGVRQAAFWVLLKSACPSVLVEMGFISNQEEEAYLASAKGQDEMAGAMFKAFGQFYRKPPRVESPVVVKTEEMPIPELAPKAESGATKKGNKNEKQWAVQIFSSRTILPAGDANFKGLKNCGYVHKGEWYKYYYGVTNNRKQAEETMRQLRSLFPDCFIISL